MHPHRPRANLHRGGVPGGGVCRVALHQSDAEKVAVLNSSHHKPAFCDCKVLMCRVVWSRYQTGGTEDAAVLVVHMTPESVLNTDQYRHWMERFGSVTLGVLSH